MYWHFIALFYFIFCFNLSGMLFSMFERPVQTLTLQYLLPNQNLNSKKKTKKQKITPKQNTIMQLYNMQDTKNFLSKIFLTNIL